MPRESRVIAASRALVPDRRDSPPSPYRCRYRGTEKETRHRIIQLDNPVRLSVCLRSNLTGLEESSSHGIIPYDYPLGYRTGYPPRSSQQVTWIIVLHYPKTYPQDNRVQRYQSISDAHSSSGRFGRRITRPERVAVPPPLTSVVAD